jgi:hypothetical protein
MQELNTTQPIGWFIEVIAQSKDCDRLNLSSYGKNVIAL